MSSEYYAPPKMSPELIDLQNYLEWLHDQVFGLGQGNSGTLSNRNVSNWHSGANGHGEMLPVAVSSDPSESTLAINTQDAGASYDTNVQALINELKADYNSLIIQHNLLLANYVALKEAMRTSNQSE